MNGLNLEQETALTIAWMRQDSVAEDFSHLGITRAFVALKNMGMIRLTTDMNYQLALFQGMLPLGAAHYDQARSERRRFQAVRDDADELMMVLAAQDKRKHDSGESSFVQTDCANADVYRELSRAGLIDVRWADDAPYLVQVTNKGRSYAEGWFQDQMDSSSVQINVSPTFHNDGSVHADSSSSSTATTSIHDVTLGATIGSIIDLNISDAEKQVAQDAVKDLDAAAKSKDETSFAEKLEKVASIAKSSSTLAPILLSFAKTALGMLL